MLRAFAMCLFVLAGCAKTDPPPPPAPSASVAAAAIDAAPPVAAAITWAGTYTSTAGPLYVPTGNEWAGTKWRGDESADGLGDGPVSLSIDSKTGKVTGVVEGPVGPGILNGTFADGQVKAVLTRKVATDNGFTGSLVGTVTGDKLDGVMHVASWDAHTIRSLTFSLGKK